MYLPDFQQTINEWQAALARYSHSEFQKKISGDSWSLAELYWHISEGTMKFHLQKIAESISDTDHSADSKSFPGKVIFLLHRFPPKRIRVQRSAEYTTKVHRDTAEAFDRLQMLGKMLKEIKLQIETQKPAGKSQHPALGWLRADEWYRLILWHLNHHRSQRRRIEKINLKTA